MCVDERVSVCVCVAEKVLPLAIVKYIEHFIRNRGTSRKTLPINNDANDDDAY